MSAPVIFSSTSRTSCTTPCVSAARSTSSRSSRTMYKSILKSSSATRKHALKVCFDKASPQIRYCDVLDENDLLKGVPTRGVGYWENKPKFPEGQIIRDEAHALARALYMEYELFESHTLSWPIAWTRTTCFIFLPPDGTRHFLHRGGFVYKPLCWRVQRTSGVHLLADVWNLVHHYGVVPHADEQSSKDPTALPFKLSAENFAFKTWSPTVGDLDTSEIGVIDSSADTKFTLCIPPARASLLPSMPSEIKKNKSSPRVGPRIRAWLMDSGCPLDLIDRSRVRKSHSLQQTARPIHRRHCQYTCKSSARRLIPISWIRPQMYLVSDVGAY